MKTLNPEQVIALSETANLLHRIAAAEIRERGFYTCMYEGRRTLVLPDEDIVEGNPQGGE